MTSKKLSEQLAAVGHAIAPDTIRKNWGKGAPRNSAEAYMRWTQKNGGKPGNTDLQELKRQKVEKEIAVLEQRRIAEERDNRIRDGELVERAVVRTGQAKIASKAVAVMIQKFETELPPKQDGLPAAEIAAMNRKAIHEIRVILSTPGVYDN